MDSTRPNYYDHNLDRYHARTHRHVDGDALREFISRVPAGGKILDAGCGSGRDLKAFNRLGFEADGIDSSPGMVELARRISGCPVIVADLRLLSLPRERYDGVWAHRSLIHLTPDECRRAMASLFLALKSGGILFVSIDEGEGSIEDRTDDPTGPARLIHRYRADDFASLVRQHGFILLASGRDTTRSERLAFVARRI